MLHRRYNFGERWVLNAASAAVMLVTMLVLRPFGVSDGARLLAAFVAGSAVRWVAFLRLRRRKYPPEVVETARERGGGGAE